METARIAARPRCCPRPSVVSGVSVAVGVLTVTNRRTGIQLSADGIRIGAVSRVRRRRRGDLPWGSAQRGEVFFCPWDGVQRAMVVTDAGALKEAGGLRKPPVRLGVLWAPFAKAALLIEIDKRRAVFPEFREPDWSRPFFRPYHPGPFSQSRIWYAPTRRPELLRLALARYAPAQYQPSP